MIRLPKFILCLIPFAVVAVAQARPETAARHGIVHCSACHVSPTGGGIRNAYGKAYPGWIKKSAPSQNYYQIDLRAIAFVPGSGDIKSQPMGLGLMQATASVNLPLVEDLEERDHGVVLSYDLATWISEPLREAYIYWRTKNAYARQVLFGRFLAPFGLMTDEHRTYARMQNRTTFNDFYLGALVSGEPSLAFHYDVAVVNGFQTDPKLEGAKFLSTGPTSGSFVNARFSPTFFPGFFGVSGSYFSRHSSSPGPYSGAAYSALSFDRLTGNRLRGALLLEYQLSRFWPTPGFQTQDYPSVLIANNPYLTMVSGDLAEAWYGQVNLDLSTRFTLMYKFDRLLHSTDFRGNFFNRHGFGFRYHPAANMTLTARAEYGRAGAPFEASVGGNSDAYWLVYHYWL